MCLWGMLLGLFASVQSARADLVYNNSTNNWGVDPNNGDPTILHRFTPTWGSGSVRTNHEVGDQIFLSNPIFATYMTNFDFEYYGYGGNGNESLQVRFYLNDGPGGTPGTKFFDYVLDVSDPSWRLDKATVPFGPADLIWMGQAVALPDVFTWTVEFSGTTDPGEDWGLYVYSPPSLGNSYTSYWNNDPMNGWLLSVSQNDWQMDFGARVWGIPEPSSLGLGIAGGLLLLMLRSRQRS